MSKRKRSIWLVVLLAILSNGIILLGNMITQSIWISAFAFGVTTFSILVWYYFVHHRKHRVQYPLVPPEGIPDIYLPRTKIPRPIYEDFRKIEERSRKLKEIRKMTRNKKS